MLALENTHHIDDFDKGPIRRSLFSNGAVSLFHYAENFTGARVQLHFLAGSIFENKDQHGLSHLIEHMAFKDGDSNIIKELELSGAGLNAYTYKENVCFEMSCLSRQLEELLPKFLDNFMNIQYTDEQLMKEKKVILQELRDELDDHETMAVELVFKKNFDEKIGHSIGGTVSSVSKYGRKDVDSFYKKYYRPERMLLVVVAGKQIDNLEDIFIQKMKGIFPYRANSPFRLKAKDKITKLSHFKSKTKRKMENGLFVLSFDGPSINSKNYYDYVVLDDLLFEGMSSIFFKELREKTPLVYGYGSSVNCFSSCGNYLMIFNTSKKNLGELRASCLNVLRSYQNHFFGENEVEMVKQRVIDSWELSFDDLEERVEFIAGTEIYQLDEFSIESIQTKIKNTSPKSLNILINKMMSGSFSELTFEPK